MIKKRYYVLAIYFLSLIGCSVQDNNTASQAPAAAKTTVEKARVCASCHDLSVKTSFVEAPPLAGRSYDDLMSAIEKVHEYYVKEPSLMHDFKSEDIHGIATYFSSRE